MSPDAAYWRAYRAANRDRLNAQERARRALGRVRGDRSAEYAKRASRAVPKLGHLFADLVRGGSVAFWDEELAMDIRQERSLAVLEGRDPDQAEKAYRARELAWAHMAMGSPLDVVIATAIGEDDDA